VSDDLGETRFTWIRGSLFRIVNLTHLTERMKNLGCYTTYFNSFVYQHHYRSDSNYSNLPASFVSPDFVFYSSSLLDMFLWIRVKIVRCSWYIRMPLLNMQSHSPMPLSAEGYDKFLPVQLRLFIYGPKLTPAAILDVKSWHGPWFGSTFAESLPPPVSWSVMHRG